MSIRSNDKEMKRKGAAERETRNVSEQGGKTKRTVSEAIEAMRKVVPT
jgi:uncharacterized protein YjbJ (UPF0337 family)